MADAKRSQRTLGSEATITVTIVAAEPENDDEALLSEAVELLVAIARRSAGELAA